MVVHCFFIYFSIVLLCCLHVFFDVVCMFFFMFVSVFFGDCLCFSMVFLRFVPRFSMFLQFFCASPCFLSMFLHLVPRFPFFLCVVPHLPGEGC